MRTIIFSILGALGTGLAAAQTLQPVYTVPAN